MILLAAFACLIVWIVFTFVMPLGPSGAAIHLLLGAAAVLVVRWWALRDSGK